jgi:hypothetical protein
MVGVAILALGLVAGALALLAMTVALPSRRATGRPR